MQTSSSTICLQLIAYDRQKALRAPGSKNNIGRKKRKE